MNAKVWHIYDLNGTTDPAHDPNNEGFGADLEFSFITPPEVQIEVIQNFLLSKKARPDLMKLYKKNAKDLCKEGAFDCSDQNETIFISQESLEFIE